MIEQYLNLPHVWEALAVPSAVGNYSVASAAVATAFGLTNDGAISTEPQVRYILENEIDVLFYQGNLDLACNTAGNIRWANSMQWKGQTAFAAKSLKPWTGDAKESVGTMKEVFVSMKEGSKKKTRFSFVTIDGSGHMVPQDQPEAALDMLTRWIFEKDFV